MYLSFQNFKKMIEETGRCSISGACEILHTLFDELEKLEDWDEENCLKISMRTNEIAQLVKEAQVRIGTASDYHNLAVEYARTENEDLACDILDIALATSQCKNEIDLLADYLKYCISAGKIDEGKCYYSRLQEAGTKRWNWRAYSFAIDFRLSLIQGDDEEHDLMMLARNFKDKIRYSEEPYISFAEIYHAFNKFDEEEKELLSALDDPCLQNMRCAKVKLKLADLYFERGDIDKALNYAVKAYNSVSAQPEINCSYAYSLAALCRISKLYNEEIEGDVTEIVKKILEEKKCAKQARNLTAAYKELERQYEILKIRYNLNDDFEE